MALDFVYYPIAILVIFVLSGLRIVYQYDQGVRFTLGKFTSMMQPGLRLVVPVIQSWEKIDMRVRVVDVPDQDAITKDNVSVKVNAVIYFAVKDAKHAVLQVEDYVYATSQLAQTTMRDVVGETTLDELLAEREKISQRIRLIVDKATDEWGINIRSVDLKHIELPEDLKRVMGKEAEAERERRAVIIRAKGEFMAAENMAKAAKILSREEGALHLRTLQSINELSSDQSNTIVFATPLEVLRAFEKFSGKK